MNLIPNRLYHVSTDDGFKGILRFRSHNIEAPGWVIMEGSDGETASFSVECIGELAPDNCKVDIINLGTEKPLEASPDTIVIAESILTLADALQNVAKAINRLADMSVMDMNEDAPPTMGQTMDAPAQM